MYVFAKVRQEIRELLNAMLERGDTEFCATRIAHAIMAAHPKCDGDDADFHLCCSYEGIRDEVRDQLNKLKHPTPQLTLEGFQYLQRLYDIERGGEQMHVPIEAMTDDELEAKAKEHYARGATEYAHGDELMRYRELRHGDKPSFRDHPGNRPHA
jgi:hypothetical protein